MLQRIGTAKLQDTEVMYQNLKEYLKEKKLSNSLTALEFAKEVHADTIRRDGEPYFIHPLSVASRGIALGINDDISISTNLLHDTKEEAPECDLENLNVADQIKFYVGVLTFNRGNMDKLEAQKIYYKNIEQYLVTIWTKLLDRMDNVSTMGWSFTPEKIASYIKETRTFYPHLLNVAHEKSTNDIALWFVEREISSFLYSNERFVSPNNESTDRKSELRLIKNLAYFPKKKNNIVQYK